jgi:hypothetical protein
MDSRDFVPIGIKNAAARLESASHYSLRHGAGDGRGAGCGHYLF